MEKEINDSNKKQNQSLLCAHFLKTIQFVLINLTHILLSRICEQLIETHLGCNGSYIFYKKKNITPNMSRICKNKPQ